MISTEAAEMPLDEKDVDMAKVQALRKHMPLVKALDQWILTPDHDLLPRMRELEKVVRHIYTLPRVMTLYRGFDLNSHQDSLGLKKLPHVGQNVHFESDSKPLSFSTEIDIARAFGGVVLSAQFDTRKTSMLYITDELSYLVSELRNLDLRTQKEVVILPPSKFDATVVQAKSSPFSWLGW